MIAGSPEWWIVVQSTKFSEAETMLRGYKAALMEAKIGTPEYVAAAATIHRINAEIHRLAQITNKITLRNVMRDMLDSEMYEAIITEAARREQDMREC